VSGELPERIVVEADGTGTVASFVRALGTLPREHRWVLVGGFAVNLRISTLHRLTGDVDTPSRVRIESSSNYSSPAMTSHGSQLRRSCSAPIRP
jgi:hypothetical protein